MANAADAYSLFVSCVEGSPCTRFGTRTLIGAERASDNVIHWFPERVVALTHAEHRRYLKEYTRLLRDGDLRPRTAAEWLAQNLAPESKARASAADPAPPEPEDRAT